MARPKYKSVHLTAKQYKALLARHSLRQSDGAWLCDHGLRQGCYWMHKGVSGSPALLLMAFDEGLISAEWLATKIHRPIS